MICVIIESTGEHVDECLRCQGVMNVCYQGMNNDVCHL